MIAPFLAPPKMQNAALAKPTYSPEPTPRRPLEVALLYGAAGIAAFTAIAYELLLASYTTFLMGASVFQYSLVISLMMASMGVGSYLSKNWESRALPAFLFIEIVLAFLAAVSIPALYYSFYSGIPPYFVLSFAVIGIGVIIGMEIPLISHLTRSDDALPKLLFFDYFGGFIGGLAFPIFLLPVLGFFKMAAVLAACNAGLALILLVPFRHSLSHSRRWFVAITFTLILSITAYIFADDLRRWMELNLFEIYDVTYSP